MAFDDSNDIKIKVSIDAQEAVDGAKSIKSQIDEIFKAGDSTFRQLAKASRAFADVEKTRLKEASKVAREEIAGELALAKEKEKTKQRLFEENTRRKAIAASFQLATEKQNAQEEIALIALVDAKAKQASDAALKRLQIEKDAEVELSRQKLKLAGQEEETRRAINKQRLKNDALSIPRLPRGEATLSEPAQPTGFMGNLRQFNAEITSLAASWYLVKEAVNNVIAPVKAFYNTISFLSEAAGRVEGLATAFGTLQRNLGADPTRSLDALRKATQGLISDVDLYQKANQAVLLGVPTETFNEAAGAAVKLGRAMGIDATLGLESLSIGLGRQSRLYLDNLGIVVSATEAYQNFARENNLLASELTDAEKRAAFYAEALRKIRERADELPDPIDSVATAYQRASVQGDNLFTSFVTGFNESRTLATELNGISTSLKNLIPFAQDAGKAIGDFAGLVIIAIDRITSSIPALAALKFALQGIAELTGNAPKVDTKATQEAIAQQEALLVSQKKNLKDLQENLMVSSVGGRDAEIAAAQTRIDETTATLEGLRKKLVEVNATPPITIKPTIDKSAIEQDAADTSNLVEQILKKTRQDAGGFQLAGLDASQTKEFGEAIQKVTRDQELGVVTLEKSQALLQQQLNTYLELGRIGSIKQLTAEWSALEQEIKKSGDATGELRQKQANAAQKIEEYNNRTAANNRREREEFEGFVNFQIKAEKKLASEQQRLNKQAERERIKIDKQVKEILSRTNRFAKVALPKDFNDRLLNAFKNFKPGSEEFNKELIDIQKQAQKTGVDLNLLADEAKNLAQQFAKGVPAIRLQTQGGQQGQNDAKKSLEDLKKQSADVRGIFQSIGADFGREGAFFGFDISGMPDKSGLTQDEIDNLNQQAADAAGAITAGISQQLMGAFSSVLNEDYAAAAQQVGAAVGTAIGAAIGSYFGPGGTLLGAQIGAAIGSAIGKAIYELNGDSDATKNRKAIDKYFGEIFDEERLGAIVTRRVVGGATDGIYNALTGVQETIKPTLMRFSDFVFTGMTAYNGQTFFGGEGFFNYFNTLSGEVKNSFQGVGFAIAASLGIAEEQARLVGAAIANNIGGSLQNLQVLVQSTGKSFEELGEAIIKAFFDGQLSIQEAYNSLVALQNIAQNGIPGAFGDVKQAAENFQTALAEGKGSRFLIDSFRDIGYEVQDLKGSFRDVVNTVGAAAGLNAQQIELLFQVFKANGINSIEEFTNASNAQLITILANLEKIKQGSRDIFTTPDTSGEGSQDNNDNTDDKKGGGGGNRAADLRKQQEEQAAELIRQSREYAKILDDINNKIISQVEGAKKIKELNDKALKAIKDLATYTAAYQNLLKKDAKLLTQKDLENLVKYANDIARLKKFLEGLERTGQDAKAALDLKSILPFIKDLNQLGVVSRQAGVELDKTIDILVKGFLQGRLTIGQVNDQIKKIRENLGGGIPNKIGAVTDAFQNLIDAGQKGGSFSTDAFLDIFAEFREKFQKEGSALREAQRKTLTANLDAAQKAFNEARDPAAAEEARKALDEAKKALDDFSKTVPKPDLADLRNELLRTFNPQDVDKFFQALDESGVGGFEELAKAGSESIIAILGRLRELGFNFGTTSDDIKNINKELQKNEKAANDGNDPLKAALDIIKQFNEGAGTLPPTFDATNKAVARLNGPLEKLAGGFDNLIEKLALLSGKTFENDVVFNVRTVGDDNSKALIDIIFGAGDTVGKNTGAGKKTSSITESNDLVRLTRQLSTLIKRGQGNSARAADIRERIRRLRTAG